MLWWGFRGGRLLPNIWSVCGTVGFTHVDEDYADMMTLMANDLSSHLSNSVNLATTQTTIFYYKRLYKKTLFALSMPLPLLHNSRFFPTSTRLWPWLWHWNKNYSCHMVQLPLHRLVWLGDQMPSSAGRLSLDDIHQAKTAFFGCCSITASADQAPAPVVNYFIHFRSESDRHVP